MDKASIKTVSIVGLGYIGLPTAALLASKQLNVIGVDVSKDVVATISCGEIHIVEPDLDLIVKQTVADGYLKATLMPESADVFVITVPTPFEKDSHQPDLTYVHSAVKSIAPVLEKNNLILLESTSPVGTTEQLSKWLAELRPDLSFPDNISSKSKLSVESEELGETERRAGMYTQVHDGASTVSTTLFTSTVEFDVNIAYCPERVLPGHILRELVANDRVIGGLSELCSNRAKDFYNLFVEGECITTNSRTAEMVKLTENSFRDVNIAFANELSMICDKQDIDVWQLVQLANRHPRVNILQPGPGVGGHCIAVDPWFIVSQNPGHANLIRAAREVNDSKPEWVVNKVKQAIAEFLLEHPNKTSKEISIACYGLTFKADIDDLRESPALAITSQLCDMHSGKVIAVEPNINQLPIELKNKSTLMAYQEAIETADIHVFLVGHREFKKSKMDENCFSFVGLYTVN